LIAWKDSSPNDLLCVEWDVKPYTLTHSLVLRAVIRAALAAFLSFPLVFSLRFDISVSG